jgi:hypothetical protein
MIHGWLLEPHDYESDELQGDEDECELEVRELDVYEFITGSHAKDRR